ncbi:MAG: aminotransferase class III-fold pyridoxal phosphate-dependent enzyme [Flavobacteriales bacterium]|nr:aminotransferase class III-fold pyridoxal phosphate-dependent enzyme [Flavobacteriales bacterium]
MPTERERLLRHLAPTSESPIGLEIERAEGVYMYDPKGKKYLDLIAGISVSNIGHRHPKVVEAIKDQADKHLHLMVYGEYVQSPQVRFADALTSILPEQLNSIYFVNSGSEAVEGAIKLAKKATGRKELISFENAYHGSSNGALSLMGNEQFKHPFYPLLPETFHIRLNDVEGLQNITENTAAVFLETIQGEAGIRVPTQQFMIALREKCTETGALLVLDEIQCGFGRTGKMFAFQHFDVVPDILLLAKGMGGGMPIGAFVASKELMSTLSHNPILGHITTFGGHPVSCAAGEACLSVILENNLAAEAERKGQLFRKLLDHEEIREIRGKGLMLAIQLRDSDQLFPAIDRCIENGMVTDWFLFCDSAMRIAPPLTITDDEIAEACRIINESIE